MKHLLLIPTLILSICSFGQKNLPKKFNKIAYDKVIAYELKDDSKSFIVLDGLLNTNAIKTQKELSKSQIDSLDKFLSFTKGTKDRFDSECLKQLQIGIVYYFKDKIVADFTVGPTCPMFIIYTKNLTDPVDNYSKTTINHYYYDNMAYNVVGQKKLKALFADLDLSF